MLESVEGACCYAYE